MFLTQKCAALKIRTYAIQCCTITLIIHFLLCFCNWFTHQNFGKNAKFFCWLSELYVINKEILKKQSIVRTKGQWMYVTYNIEQMFLNLFDMFCIMELEGW